MIIQKFAIINLCKSFYFNEILGALSGDVLMEGDFQHNKYFEMAKPYLNPKVKNLPARYADLQENYYLVGLHVSRKTMKKDCTDDRGVLPLSYYLSALRKFSVRNGKYYILIFSDDLDWVEEKLLPHIVGLELPYVLPDGSAIENFSLMLQCKHFIISNSSFGATAALLGAKENSFVYIPLIWHNSQNIRSASISAFRLANFSLPFLYRTCS